MKRLSPPAGKARRRAPDRIAARLLASTAVPALLAATTIGAAAQPTLPQGGQVVAGAATIASSGSEMTVTQTSSRAVVTWNDFSIGKGYGVNVAQPNASSVEVEQVTGATVSQIFGSLSSNGKLVVANPNGIWFGPNAQVNVAGLTATTATASQSDINNFMAGGNLSLSQAGNATASVVNQGSITITQAGLAAFVAPGVRNSGVIEARLGTVQLSSGTTATLDFYGDGLVNIAVTGQTLAQAVGPHGKPLKAAVSNSGTINADGGTVLLTANVAAGVVDQVINTAGVVQARAVSQQGGEIVLDGGGTGNVVVAGTLDASGLSAGQTGGTVEVLGDNVTLRSTANINVAGDAGGGTALIGGNFHGAGPQRDASTTKVAKGATINADAVTSGNGGNVAVWSNGSTSFAGTISATGGTAGGSGGFVETSGAQLTVADSARVDTSAANGEAGTWLLDPNDVTVAASGGTISPNTIAAALSTGNVEIDTVSTGTSGTGDITISSAIIYNSANSLSLLAQGDIIANASVQNAGAGALNLVAGWDGSTGLSSGLVTIGQITGSTTAYGNTIAGATGSLFVNTSTGIAGVALGSAGGTTTVAANNVTLQGSDGTADAYAELGYNTSSNVISTSGAITVLAKGNVTLAGGGQAGAFAQVGNGGGNAETGFSSGGNQTLAGDITVSAADAVALEGGGGSGAYAQIGHGGFQFAPGQSSTFDILTFSGDIDVSSGGGVMLQGGSGGDSYAQIGHGGAQLLSVPRVTSLEISGGIVVSAVGDISLSGGSSTGANYAQIGHGGYGLFDNGTDSRPDSSLSGSITVESSAGAVSLTGTSNAYAQIGHGGEGVFSGDAYCASNCPLTYAGSINVTAATGLTLQGGSDAASYALIGHGDADPNDSAPAISITNSNISVSVGGTLTATSGTGGFAIGEEPSGGTVSGSNVAIAAQTLVADGTTDTIGGASDSFTQNTLLHDLDAGEVVLALGDGLTVTGLTYTSGNALGLLSQQEITTTGAIANSAGGEIVLVGGWNGSAGAAPTTNGGAFDLTTDGSGVLGSASNYGNGSAGSNGVSLGAGVTTAATTDSSAIAIAGPTLLTAPVTLSGNAGSITLFSSVNGGEALTAATSGTTTFLGNLGSGTNLTSLGVSGPTTIDASAITTTGTQSYSGAVTLGANTTLATTNSLVDFASTVDDGTANTHSLTISSGTGGVTFGAAVGGRTALANLSVTGGGPMTFDGNVTTGGSQSYAGALVLGGNVVLAAGGSISLSGGSNFASSDSLSLLAQGDVDFSANLQNAGTGAINIVAGWDGSTGLSGGSFTFSSLATTTSSYGHAGAGNVNIGNGTQTAGIAVGSANGATNVAADNVTLSGGSTAGAYAQLGYYTDTSSNLSSGAISASGAITVLAAGNVTLAGGSGGETNKLVSAYAQIGHGGGGTNVVSTSDVSQSLSGSITITADGAVSLSAGSTAGDYAQIGHGGFRFDDGWSLTTASITGGITITAGSVTLSGPGQSNFSDNYVQIGLGGDSAFQSAMVSGSLTVGGAGSDISVTANSGNIALSGGTNGDGTAGDYAQIGDGGSFFAFAANIAGTATLGGENIRVTATSGNVTLTGGSTSSSNYYAQIGDGGSGDVFGQASGAPQITLGSTSGTISVTAGGTVSLAGGSGSGSDAQIGEGGYQFASSTATTGAVAIADTIVVGAGGNLALTSGSGTSYAQIGSGDFNTGAATAVTGNIDVSVGGTLTATSSGSNSTGYAIGQEPGSGGTVSSSNVYIAAQTLVAGGVTDSISNGSNFANMLQSDLNANAGEVVLALGDAFSIGGLSYSGGGALGLLSQHELSTTTGAIANSGSGAIVLLGGWNGSAGASSTTSGGAFDLSSDSSGALSGGSYGLGSNGVSLGGNVGTAATGGLAIALAGPTQLSGTVTLQASGGLIEFFSTLTGNGKSLTVIDNAAPEFAGAVSGLANATLAPSTAANTIAVGDSSLQALAAANTSYDFSAGAASGLYRLESGAVTGTVTIGTVDDSGTITMTRFSPVVSLALVNGIAGAISVTGTYDGTGSLALASGSGGISLSGGSIATSAGQTYSGAVSLGVNTTLAAGSGSAIVFAGTVTGAGETLDVTSGTTTFDGTVNLGTLAVQAATLAISSGSITTTGGQTYSGAVTLGANTVLSDSSTSAGITFDGAVNAASAGGESLAVTTTGASAATSFGGAVGGAEALASLTVNGGATLTGGSVTTSGTGGQTYSGAVSLGANTTLSSGSGVVFTGTVTGAGETLDIATGATTFSGAVTVGSLQTQAATLGRSNGSITITTTGGQSYSGTVTLGTDANATLADSAGSAITFDSTLAIGSESLTVSTGGTVTLGGAVTGGYFTSTGAGLTVFDSSVNITNLTTGAASLDGGGITSQGFQIYSGAVSLGQNTQLETVSNSVITLDGLVSGNAHSLTVLNQADAATLGAGATGLASLTIQGPAVLDGNVTTSGTETYTGGVTIGSTLTLTTTNGLVDFKGTVNDAAGDSHVLSIAAGTGGVTFGSAVGATEALAALNTTGTSGTITLDGNVTTGGTQTYAGPVTLGGNVTLTTTNSLVSLATVSGSGHTLSVSSGSGGVTFNGLTLAALNLTTTGTETLDTGTYNITAGDVFGSAAIPVTTNGTLTLGDGTTFSGAVSLGSNTTLAGGANAITFAGTVDGADALAINTTGTTTFSGAVGSGTALSSLGVSGPSTLDGGSVTTSAGQTYSGAVTLGANTTLAAGGGTVFESTVSDGGNGYALDVTRGTTSFGGAVSVGSLQIQGAMLEADVTTSASQSYSGALSLGTSDVVLDAGGSITLTGGSSYNSTHALSLLAQGDVDFDAGLQNAGTGAINVVAGWDGSTGLSGGSFSFSSLTAGSYGHAGAGNINIGNGSQTSGIAVGSANGATNVAGDNVTLQGSGTNGYAQLGYNLTASVISTSGNITVLAASNVMLAGGSGTGAFAQIGDGGYEAETGQSSLGSQTVSGSISVSAGDTVSLGAGRGMAAYAQIGHGGYQFGDGSTFTTASISGGISISAGSGGVTLTANQGGSNTDGYAQIGNGGDQSFVSATVSGSSGDFGAIGISTSGGVSLAGGGVTRDYAQIGDGGFDSARSLVLNGGTGSFQNSGNITLGAASLTLTGGNSSSSSLSDAYAQIGDGGDQSFVMAKLSGSPSSGVTSGNLGNISITVGGAVSLAAGSGQTAYAQIGDGGFSAAVSLSLSSGTFQNSGNVTLTAASLVLSGGDSGGLANAYAQIGDGGMQASEFATLGGSSGSSGNVGNIGVTVSGGAVSLAGGSSSTSIGAYAQIGDGGYQSAESLKSGSSENSGTITLTAGSLTLAGGSGTAAYAQIGQGDETKSGGGGDNTGNIDLRINGTLVGTTGTYLIGDATATAGGVSSANVLVEAAALNLGSDSAFWSGVTSDLAGGEVVVAITGAGGLTVPALSYTSGNSFGLLSQFELSATGAISNDGSGGIVLVGGWNGTAGLPSTQGGSAFDLTSDSTGALSNGSFGNGSPGSNGVSLAAGVATSATSGTGIAIAGPTLLTANVTLAGGAGAVTLYSTVYGDFALTANSSGLTTFSGAVGSGTALASLGVRGPAALDGGSVATTGGQTYSGAVTLGADTVLRDSGSGITFASTVGSDALATPRSLTVSGDVSFGGAVGANDPLNALTVTGTASFGANAGSVTTSGAQSYGGAVTLDGNLNLISTGDGSAGALVTLGAVSGGGNTLTVSTGAGGLTLNGVTLGGLVTSAVSGTETLESGSYSIASPSPYSFGNSTGATRLSGTLTLGQATTFSGAVTLSGNTTLSDSTGAIVFAGTVSGAGQSLVVTSGTATFGGAVTVGSVATQAAALDGGSVATSGGQSYGAVTLGANTTLSDGNSGAITFGGTLSGGSHNLTVTDSGGTLSLTSGASGLGAFNSAGAGLTVFGGAVNAASVTTGAVNLDGGNIATSGGQSYGAATLGANTTLSDSNSGAIIFGGTMIGGAHNLTVTDSSGALILTSGASNLGAFNSAGAGLTVFDGTVSAASVMTAAVTLDGGSVATSGGQSYGAAMLGANTTLSDGVGGAITFDSTLSGGLHDLTVTDAAGTLTLTSGASSLGAFDSAVTALTVLDGAVTAASVTTGTAALDGGSVTTSGGQTYAGALTFGGATLLEAGGSITLSGSTSYSSAQALTLLAQGDVDLYGSLQNAASGAINVVAGWDGSTGLSGGSFTFSSLAATAGSYGHAGLGNVNIGDGNQLAGVAIGSASGETNVAANNVTLQGSTNATSTEGYAQLGYNLTTAGSTSGAITVLAAGNVTLAGGAGTGGFAQIGDGGYQAEAGQSSLGTQSLTGSIAVTAGGGVALTGGSGTGAYAQIGHGGADFASFSSSTGGATLSGDITVSAANGGVNLAGGSGSDAYAQIGHGDPIDGIAPLAISGNIDVSVSGTLTGTTGTGPGSFFAIGAAPSGGTVSASNVFIAAQTLVSDGATDTIGGSDGFTQNTLLRDLDADAGAVVVALGDGLTVAGLSYSSGGTLGLLSQGELTTTGAIANTGSGGIVLVGGWNGSAGAPSLGGSFDLSSGSGVLSSTGDYGVGGKGVSLGGNVTTAPGGGRAIDIAGLTSLAATVTLSGGAGATTLFSSIDGDFALSLATSGGGGSTIAGTVGGTTPLASLTVSGAAALDGGSLATTGGQSYSGAVSLGGNTSLTTTNGLVTLGPVSGAGDTLAVNSGSGGLTLNGVTVGALTLTTTGVETLNAGTYTIGAGGSAYSYSSPGGVTLNGALTLSNATSFGAAVTLGSNTTLSDSGGIVFASTISGAGETLAITQGTVTFSAGATLGALQTEAATLALSGGTTIATTGGQTYSGAVTLGSNATLADSSASGIVFESTVGDGGHGDALDIAQGGTAFNASVSVGALQTQAATLAMPSGSITTKGGQTYSGAVTLGANTVLADTASGNITFDGTLDGGLHNLTVTDSGGTLTLTSGASSLGAFNSTGAGLTVFDGAVMAASVTTGAVRLAGGSVGTSAGQSYSGAATLGANTTLGDSGSGIVFASTVGGAETLAITQGRVTFAGGVTLGALQTQAATLALPSGAAIATTGGQTYSGAVTLGANASLSAGAGGITFDGTVSGANETLTANAGNGGVTFNGIDLAALSVSTSGTETLNSGSYTIGSGGSYSFGATTLSGSLIFGQSTGFGAATLAADTALATMGAGESLSFNGTLSGGSHSLTVTDAGGTLTLGAGASSLGTFNSAGAGLTVLGGTVTAVNVTTGAVSLDGSVATSGGQSYGAAVLGGSTALSDSAGGAISFAGTLSGGSHGLTVTDGGGTLTLSSGASSLGAFDSAGTGRTVFGGAVTATSVATGAVALDGGSVTTSGGQSYGAATLGADTALADTGGGAIAFVGTVDGAHALTVNAAGTASFAGAVTVASLTLANSGGTTTLGSGVGSVTTTGDQLYGNALTLAGTISIATSGGNVTFAGTIAGPGADLAVDLGGGGSLVLEGDAGSAAARLGTMTVRSGVDVTIANGATAYVVTFVESGISGTTNFGSTLNATGNATTDSPVVIGDVDVGALTVNNASLFNVGPLVNATLATGSVAGFIDGPGAARISFVGGVNTGGWTFDGIGIRGAPLLATGIDDVPSVSMFHLESALATTLANPGASLAVGGLRPAAGAINPQGGCEATQKDASGNCLIEPSSGPLAPPTIDYGNAFLRGLGGPL